MEENASIPQGQPVVCTIHKMTFSEGRAYRYHISDRDGNLLYVAEPTGLLLPSPRRLIEFFAPDHRPAARLEPPETAPWLRATYYELFVGKAKKPEALIYEEWRPVDMLLLRLPRYTVQLGEHRYIARGSRYGEHFYEIFLAPEAERIKSPSYLVGESAKTGQVYSPPVVPGEEIKDTGLKEGNIEWPEEEPAREESQVKVGLIQRPLTGPSYIITSDVAPLCQAVLVLAALAIIIDMETYG